MPMKNATATKVHKLITPTGSASCTRLKAKSLDGKMSLLDNNGGILSLLHAMLSALGSNALGSVVLASLAMPISLMLAVPLVGGR